VIQVERESRGCSVSSNCTARTDLNGSYPVQFSLNVYQYSGLMHRRITLGINAVDLMASAESTYNTSDAKNGGT